MERREAAGSFSTIDMLRRYIKVFSIGKLKARLLSRVRNNSWRLVVFEKGIVREIVK